MENKEIKKTIKRDAYCIDPRLIVVKDGFNSRSDFGDLDELAAQIREQGLLNPITVKPIKNVDGSEVYQLVDGERRYRAIMRLIDEGMELYRVKAEILSASVSEEEMLIQQALRNEGKNFNQYEWGVLTRKLMDRCGLTLTEAATKLGKNPGALSRYMGYLEMIPEISERIRDGKVTGSDITRLMRAHKNNQQDVLKELLRLEAKAADNGKEKVSLKDSDENSKTIQFKNTQIVKKGLDVLFKYITQYSKQVNAPISLDLNQLHNALKAGQFLGDIFTEMVQKSNNSTIEPQQQSYQENDNCDFDWETIPENSDKIW